MGRSALLDSTFCSKSFDFRLILSKLYRPARRNRSKHSKFCSTSSKFSRNPRSFLDICLDPLDKIARFSQSSRSSRPRASPALCRTARNRPVLPLPGLSRPAPELNPTLPISSILSTPRNHQWYPYGIPNRTYVRTNTCSPC